MRIRRPSIENGDDDDYIKWGFICGIIIMRRRHSSGMRDFIFLLQKLVVDG